MRRAFTTLFLALPFLALGVPAHAQSFLVEGGLGGAAFTESSGLDHVTTSVGARWHLLPRLSIGPEVVYMKGPETDRDLVVTGNVVYDFGSGGVTPYVLGGAGLYRHSNTLFLTNTVSETFTSTEGSFTAGGGVRIPFASGWYIAPEARIGWETHVRLQVLAGYRWD